MAELAEWDSFYVIVGSAAGALIGLQFVVMTLLAERPMPRAAEAGAVFGTPTIVHFSTVLLLSALVRVPWPGIAPAAILWGLVGLGGVVYAASVAWRARTQTAYRPDLEDHLCHIVLPLGAYTILALSALGSLLHTRGALFGIGATTLILLFTGIHNAWDSTTFNVFTQRKKDPAN